MIKEKKFDAGMICSGFRVDSVQYVEEVQSTSYVMTHIQSGAKLLYLANDDDNKVFSVSFRTTPDNSTGVPHICEHSTLCGSRKFPLKEPFVELVKGSLNTFLNAMTFPDKTMYPVASRNAIDFRNLMDVYLDAVFFPNFLKDPQILQQEGWHYELEEKNGPLTYSGVVYNEMKGVFSSPDSQLDRKVMAHLFPQTTYGVESGGDPDDIPQLTQEEFVAFHKRYYHPSNSYFFLYGDLDIDDTLAFIDSEYLSSFTAEDVHTDIAVQPCPGSTVKTYSYGIGSDESTDQKTMHSLTYVIDDAIDTTLGLALKVLTYVYLASPAAPLKKLFIDEGLGKDISGDFQDGILQPLWGITINGSEQDAQEKILPLLHNYFKEVVAKGIDKTLLTGALNRLEFSLREADFAGRPKGLIYGIRCMDTWLYGRAPEEALRYEESLKVLRAGIETDYYEKIIQTYILDNPYYALISLVPEKGLTEKKEEATAQALAAYKKSLSDEELQKIIDDTKALKKRQEAPDSPEALATIPTLSRTDLTRDVDFVEPEVEKVKDVDLCYVEDKTNGITYINLFYDLTGFSESDLPYIYLLADMIGDLDTENHDYIELASLIDLHTGGISYGVQSISSEADNSYRPFFRIKAKALTRNTDKVMALLEEITEKSVFSRGTRLAELIEEEKTGWDTDAFRNGQTLVTKRLLSYVSQQAAFDEAGELSYYRFLADMAKTIRKDGDTVGNRLKDVAKKLFVKARLTVSVTGEAAEKEALKKVLPLWLEAMPEGEKGTLLFDFDLQRRNEGIMTGGKVQYVAKGGNFRKHGFEYTGAMSVLTTILQYEYLWIKVRVQGGAYGAHTRFSPNGDLVFCSYRDPNLAKTIQAYDDLPSYLESFDIPEREMTKYVIGTLSRIDTPLTPQLRTGLALGIYFAKATKAKRQERRDQLLNTTAGDIRDLAPVVKAVMNDNNLCVMGSERKIKEEGRFFDDTVSLPK